METEKTPLATELADHHAREACRFLGTRDCYRIIHKRGKWANASDNLVNLATALVTLRGFDPAADYTEKTAAMPTEHIDPFTGSTDDDPEDL